MELDEAMTMIESIKGSDYHLTNWEKKFLRGMQCDLKNGIRPSLKEGWRIHEIYRQAKRFNTSVFKRRR